MSMNYWQKRQEKANKDISDKTIEDIEKQLKKYYSSAMKRTIADFEATYNKMLDAVKDGREPTPADLYKLDQYWQMQAQLKQEMQKLGDKEIELLSKKFEEQWNDIYKSSALPSDKAFRTISTGNAKQMINSAWLADGKTFSQRIWGNTERLVETLNEQLVHCVVTGKKPTELKRLLQERFNVSYNRADTLVKTEVAHIETAAAAQRYKDYGLEKYEFLGRDEHDIGCACKKLNGKQFFYSEMQIGKNAPPLHPNCRCAIIPVIEDDELDFDYETKKFGGYTHHCQQCGNVFDTKFPYENVCPKCGAKTDESTFLYKDAQGNRKEYTWDEEKAMRQLEKDRKAYEERKEDELQRIKIEQRRITARMRADVKTDRGLSLDDAVSTAPFQRQLAAAKETDGEFVYYHHQCPMCGRWFDSTAENKKKCPICGSKIDGTKKTKVEILKRKCKECGKLFDVPKDHRDRKYCEDCMNDLMTSDAAMYLKKHGYTEKGITEALTDERVGFFFRKELRKDGYDMYNEYIKRHPEEKEHIDSITNILDYEKHFFVCIDCGEVFFVENTKNNAAKRCPDCQAEYRRKYKAEKERERRKKRKNN